MGVLLAAMLSLVEPVGRAGECLRGGVKGKKFRRGTRFPRAPLRSGSCGLVVVVGGDRVPASIAATHTVLVVTTCRGFFQTTAACASADSPKSVGSGDIFFLR